MKLSSLESKSFQTPAVPLARLCEPHGYCFEGDAVHLDTRLAILAPGAHELPWALQLWACAAPPASVHHLAGHIVAEAALPPLRKSADATEHFKVSAFSWPPAGAGDYFMALVLVSGQPGELNVVHDFAVYSQLQQFAQPRLSGHVGYRLDGARVQISVERVENPRPAENQSGTLSLELWALSEPFAGGRFAGYHLAGVEIGPLNGQGELTLPPLDLMFSPPPPGTWHLVLMLREWAGGGFLTRDYTNFAAPFVSPPLPERTPEPVAEAPAVVAPEPAVPLAVAEVPAQEAVPPAPAVSPAQAPPDVVEAGVSVNSASVAELAAVKGLSLKIAEGIIKQRPFASLDQLREVKGLSKNHLKKVRALLKL